MTGGVWHAGSEPAANTQSESSAQTVAGYARFSTLSVAGGGHDVNYLPLMAHPYRPGEKAFDIELPLREHNGEETLFYHVSNDEGHTLEDVIRLWLVALTHPQRAREFPEQYPGGASEDDEAEFIRVADHNVKRIFHDDLPDVQRFALLTAIIHCEWLKVPAARLPAYFVRRARKWAALGGHRISHREFRWHQC